MHSRPRRCAYVSFGSRAPLLPSDHHVRSTRNIRHFPARSALRTWAMSGHSLFESLQKARTRARNGGCSRYRLADTRRAWMVQPGNKFQEAGLGAHPAPARIETQPDQPVRPFLKGPIEPGEGRIGLS
jgi:hypothetical protein